MGKTATRNITPGYLHGKNSLAQSDTRNGLFFKLLDAVFLCLCKSRYLFMGKADILFDFFWYFINQPLLFLRAQDKIPLPVIKLFSKLNYGFFTICLYIREDILNDAAYFF